MLEWQRTAGILALFFFAILGMVIFDDRKLKLVSYFTGVVTAVMLAGWSDNILAGIQQFAFAIGENVKPDSVGVVTSAVGLTFSQAIPIKSVRRASTTTSLSGLILSIAGFPGWIILVTNFLIFVIIILAVYFIAKKIAKWINALIQGSKKNE
jgi:hypothetical protein